MELVAKLDEMGKPAWIGLMVLGFIVFWPVGLALLTYLLWSGRMGCSKRNGWSRDVMGFSGGWGGCGRSKDGHRPPMSSGNHAFDEYRQETLRRLEEEQKEFSDYLERLRMAKDKAEFEQFMSDRSTRPAPSPTAPSSSVPASDPGTITRDVTPRPDGN